MSYTNYDKEVKKAYDVLEHYKKLINLSCNTYYKSFLANAVLLKCNSLKESDRKLYLKDIKNLKVIDNLLSNTFKRKLKKNLLKLFPSLFIRGLK